MRKFIVDESFWNLFPDAKLGVILLKGIDNVSESNDEIKNILEESNKEALKYVENDTFIENPAISVWREAYKLFKTKKGARASIEALLKRAKNGNPVSSINPLVDIYNATSLKFGLPCGAEDLDTFEGNLVLGITKGNDEFYLINEEEPSPTLENELCYKDDKGAVCRCFNWRDGERTMIKDSTKNVFVVMESIDPSRHQDLEDAINFLATTAQKHLNGAAQTYFITKENPSIDLD